MNKLRTEDQEKDIYINKLRRVSSDFQDEAASLEEDFRIKIKSHESALAKLNFEKNEQNQNNQDTQAELHDSIKHITKSKEELCELNNLNENMLTSIQCLTEQTSVNMKEIEDLEQENRLLKLETNQNVEVPERNKQNQPLIRKY